MGSSESAEFGRKEGVKYFEVLEEILPKTPDSTQEELAEDAVRYAAAAEGAQEVDLEAARDALLDALAEKEAERTGKPPEYGTGTSQSRFAGEGYDYAGEGPDGPMPPEAEANETG